MPECEDCRFWELREGFSIRPPLANGECRRHAPIWTSEKEIIKYKMPIQRKFPITKNTDWCGDFQPKEE